MDESYSSQIYSCDAMRAVTGETVRPGGLRITKRAIEFCGLQTGARLLDIGCGTGSSIEFLKKEYKIDALGIDPSPKMLQLAKSRCPDLPVFSGTAEEIPFEGQSMEAILMECCFHLADANKALREFYRVLIPEGWLIVSDIYLRSKTSDIVELSSFSKNDFMDKAAVEKCLGEQGFRLVLWEDHTHELKQLIVDIIMQYDSLPNFWKAINCDCNNCFIAKHKDAKLGYYLLVAQRSG